MPVTTNWTYKAFAINMPGSVGILAGVMGTTGGTVNMYFDGGSGMKYKAAGSWTGNQPCYFIAIGT